MVDLVLDRAVMTQEILAHLMKINEKRLLISLITKPIRPLYLPPQSSRRKEQAPVLRKGTLITERLLCFIDIIDSALDTY